MISRKALEWGLAKGRLGVLLVVLSSLLFGAVVSAQTSSSQTVRSSWRSVAPMAELEVGGDGLLLSLEDAIAVALEQNLGLQVQRFQRAQQLFRITESLGIYDLQLAADVSMSDNTSPSASQLDGADVSISEVLNYNFTLDQRTSVGGVASVQWNNRRFESNSIFSQINPSFSVDFDLVYSQPLLRNRGRLATNRDIRVARLNAESSTNDLELTVSNTIQQVADTYWSLVEAREQLTVSQESLALAEQLHEMNRVQVEVGTKAPLELTQSEAGIATRQEQIIRDAAAVEDAADQLRQLLNLDQSTLWDVAITPTTDPQTARIEIDLDRALQLALEGRPELRNERLAVEQLEIDAKFFKNQRMPSLDVQLRYGYNGLGGDVRVSEGSIFDPNPVFTVFPGGYDDALEQIVDGDFDGWQVGLNFSYPVQNRAAKARAIIANLALEGGRTQLDERLLAVRTEVRRAARAVRTAAQQIDAAKVSRELEEKNLEAEQKRYENGLSTSFQVLEIQEDRSLARSREVNAITGYRRALTAYYQAIGRLLDENGVELDTEDDMESLEVDE